MDRYLLLGVTILATTTAQLIVKWRAPIVAAESTSRVHYVISMFVDRWIIVGMLCVLCAGVAWYLIIDRISLAFAYPFMALTFVLVPLGAVFFLNENISWPQMIGILLIVAGVAINAQG